MQDSSTSTPSLTSAESESADTEDQDGKIRDKRSIEVNHGVSEVRSSEEDVVNGTRTTPPAICNKENDLCTWLLEVMEGVENVTREVKEGHETKDTLKEINALGKELRQVVDQVESDPRFVESLKGDVLVSDVRQLHQGLGDAEGTLAEKLIKLNKTNPLLLILLGAIGAGILLALLVVSAFAIHKQKNLRLEGGHGKINGTSIPVQSFKECPPPTLIPRPRSSIESYTQRETPRSSFDSASLPTDNRPSSDPRGTYDSGYKKTPSPYYSVPRPLGETRRAPNDSREHRLSGRSDDEEDFRDPYSLEGRGHNVKRIHSG
ncbi:hypothetical protein C7M84_002933 [Penaeus vannamei]|uniref:Uncharacterized protein n=1 Tax=Penaeus vannamei TaxID=6689 RepID=A0A423TPI0_PENVA|nr:hypothetical protein C7M84_002933 [Penaeus vannamei]